MTFDPARLFESSIRALDPALQVYRSDEEALDAVQAREKPLWFVSSVRDEVAEWQELAFARGLACTVIEEPATGVRREARPLRVFIAHPEELWRVPALEALWQTTLGAGAWSDAAEEQMSLLLGYTAKQRARWIAAHRRARPAWGCRTVYAILDASQRARVEAVGRRCFGTAEGLAGTTVVAHVYPARANAHALIPKGHTFARAGVQPDAFDAVFGTLRRDLTSRTLTAKLAAVLNAGLASNVQFLTRAGWR